MPPVGNAASGSYLNGPPHFACMERLPLMTTPLDMKFSAPGSLIRYPSMHPSFHPLSYHASRLQNLSPLPYLQYISPENMYCCLFPPNAHVPSCTLPNPCTLPSAPAAHANSVTRD